MMRELAEAGYESKVCLILPGWCHDPARSSHGGLALAANPVPSWRWPGFQASRRSQEPCLGVKVKSKRPGGRVSSQARVSLEMCAE